MPRINSSGWKSGDLKIHSGTLEDIPNGWELAQDMVDRAVVGAGNLYSKGQQFGADTVATQDHTLSEAQTAPHVHPYTKAYKGGKYFDYDGTDHNILFTTSNSGSAGGGQAHHHGNVDTRQQSIAVIWIRKL